MYALTITFFSTFNLSAGEELIYRRVGFNLVTKNAVTDDPQAPNLSVQFHL